MNECLPMRQHENVSVIGCFIQTVILNNLGKEGWK